MDWFDFLRQERQRKLQTNELLQSDTLAMHEIRDGERRDVTREVIADNLTHIEEIEGILQSAGLPIELPQN